MESLPGSFEEVMALFTDRCEELTALHLRTEVNLVAFEPGRIEWRQHGSAPVDLAPRVARQLGEWTGRRWSIMVNAIYPAEPTLDVDTTLPDQG